MISSKTPFILYGGDYNPDQWPKEIIIEDMKFFKDANINVVTLPVFSWALLQPDEDTYNFEWLDEILDLLKENDIFVCMATSTAVQPNWMSKKYPEILPTDFNGMKRKFGGRVNFCPNSEKYREFSVKLATKLAERYKDYSNIIAWHIGNEYDNYCYCEHCENKFKEWVKNKYKTIENVNKAWNMNFWGHTLYSFDEIVAPSGLSEVWYGYDKQCTNFQGIALDYNRFMSDSILECYLGEYNVLKTITPDIKITTNFMGTFKPLDYFKWAKHMDIVSWDNYPGLNAHPSDTSMRHDLMRGLKNGDPFMLMEQTPNQQNWQPYNSVKRPGVMRLLSYQAVAHGADTVMFFQMRQSIGACEKYHAAVIPHAGHENTRTFKECAKLGEELKSLGDTIIDSKYDAKVAIIFDWDNWWAVEFSSGPSIQLRYVEQIEKYYKAFHNLNVAVDFVEPNGDFTKYSVVLGPVLYMLHNGVANNIKNYVSNGGTFITTYFSGYVNENDLVQLGGYPAELRDMLGLWVEEIDALPPDMNNSINFRNNLSNATNTEKIENVVTEFNNVVTTENIINNDSNNVGTASNASVTTSNKIDNKSNNVGTEFNDIVTTSNTVVTKFNNTVTTTSNINSISNEGTKVNPVENYAMKDSYTCDMVCDIINLEGATPLAVYGSDFYKDSPVFTVNTYGNGKAYYIGANPEQNFLNDFANSLSKENNLLIDIPNVDGVEITRRFKDDYSLTFILNHNNDEVNITLDDKEYINLLNNTAVKGNIILKAKDVAILKTINK
ncbi:beta-galactosidase [Clostridium sp. 1001275B_160808_H3]|uniref:beta-galactosidase n=1 Tax=Clostridium sp. 1001275B_160808_H3 TaxID=2787110 RepID=UPI001897431B|nr:beta-galactosidase [Clostridium sp. 1001275B_160808_H3]